MLTVDVNQYTESTVLETLFAKSLVAIEHTSDPELDKLLAELSPEVPWGDRQLAAKRIGSKGYSSALPALLAALPDDPFWMVRCSIIQTLEKIADPAAIPALLERAQNDDFQVVRAYAAKAVDRLSQHSAASSLSM